jgi:hypothetical protein
VPATARRPDGRRSVVGVFFGNEVYEQPFGTRVGLRTRCATRVRVRESCVGREAGERHAYSANVEEATAAVMRYGCQRGEIFEGCEWRCRGRHAYGQGSRARVAGVRNTANPVRYWGATNPEPSDGSNRRGGEKPRGRHWLAGGTAGTKSEVGNSGGTGPTGGMSDAGRFTRANFKTGGWLAIPTVLESLKARQDQEGTSANVRKSTSASRR